MKTNEIIKQISFEDLQKFVIAYAKQDVQFETSIREKFAPATDESWLDRIMDRFDDIIDDFSDGDYIHYRSAFGYECEMSELFERLKKNKNFACSKRALETICFFTESLGDLSIDDSNGTMTVLMDKLKDLWNRTLKEANEDTLTEAREWIEQELFKKRLWMAEDLLYEIYEKRFNTAEDLIAKIKFFDKQIKNEAKEESDFIKQLHIGQWVCERATVMKKLKKKNEEIKAYLNKYAEYDEPAYMLFDILHKEKDFHAAEECLLKLNNLPKHKNRFNSKAEEKLKEMYLESRQIKKYKSALKNLIVKDNSMDSYKEYKNFLKTDEWPSALRELLDSIKDLDFKMQILAYEKMVDELYKAFCKAKDTSRYDYNTFQLFQEFGKDLCPKYESEIVVMLAQYFNKAIVTANDRKAYREIVHQMKTLSHYNGGTECIQKLKADWSIQYKKRPALIDELKKV